MFLELGEILRHGRLDSSTGQPLKESRPSRIELPLVSNTSCVSLRIQGESPFETRRRLRQSLHCYCIVRLVLDDPKILFVGLADLMVYGSYARTVAYPVCGMSRGEETRKEEFGEISCE
jgi:hypothetical protein